MLCDSIRRSDVKFVMLVKGKKEIMKLLLVVGSHRLIADPLTEAIVNINIYVCTMKNTVRLSFLVDII